MSCHLAEIPVEQIVRDETAGNPPRRRLESMARYGLLRPILVRAREDGRYDLGTGGASLAAARQLRWPTIPALVSASGAGAPSAEREALIVHAQRESLQALHVARLARRLLRRHEGTQAELAEEAGLDQSTLSRMVRVAECAELDAAVDREGLAFGAARALVALPPAERQALLAELRRIAGSEGRYPSVRQIEAWVRERQGRGPRVEMAPESLAAALARLRAQGIEIEIRAVRARGGRKSARKVTLLVAAADEAEIRRCLARHGAEAAPVDAPPERWREPSEPRPQPEATWQEKKAA